MFALLAFALTASAAEIARSFPPGQGARFELHQADGTQALVVISITEASARRLGVEYYITATGSLVPIELWQQYVLAPALNPGGTRLELIEGYILAPELQGPERVSGEYLKGFDGVAMNDFLFAERAELERHRAGPDEKVTTPAGEVTAARYRRERSGQTVEFWISDEAKPLGLVKLVSRGSKPEHNYTLYLVSMVRGLKPKIDPAKARPLSETGKKLLRR
jgi:hypothetical protein